MDSELSDFSPYFESLSKQKRICPECHQGALKLEQSLNLNAAYETCDCGYSQTISPPCKSMYVEWDGKRPWRNPAKRKFKILNFEDLR